MFFKRLPRVFLCSLVLLVCIIYMYCFLQLTSYNSKQSRSTLLQNCTVLRHFKENASISELYVSNLRSDILRHKALEPYFIPRETKVNIHNYSFLITAEKLCEKESPHILIVVHSVYDHVEARRTIRQSWGSVVQAGVWADDSALPNIKLIFLFGIIENVDVFSELQEESLIYGDIVLANFIDSYGNLTIKTMSALQWTIRYCPDADYLLKNDEDVVVVLPRLLELLRTVPLTHLVGRQGFQTRVVRDGSIPKWIVNKQEYEPDFYPPYILGNFYVIPNAAIGVLYQTSQYIPILSMEDVFITGVVRLVTGFHIQDVGKERACLYQCDLNDKDSIAFTVGTSYIRQAWDTLGKPLSEPEVNNTKSVARRPRIKETSLD